MTGLVCKFILSEISEKIIASEEGYSMFEPIVALKINCKNVFKSLGIDGAKSAVIMHSRENFIETSLEMVEDLSKRKRGAYDYWLLGTGFGFRVERKGQTLSVLLRVDGTWGPTQGINSPQTVRVVTVSVSEWVESIVSLSSSLSDLFRRLNRETYNDPIFQSQEAGLSELEKWLISGRNP